MPFRRGRSRGSRLGTIVNSNKEIVDNTQNGVAAGTTIDIVLCTAIQNYVGTTGTCPVGAKIFGLDLFAQAQGLTGSQTLVDFYIAKAPGSVIANLPVPGLTGGNQNRKFILHEEKGLPGAQSVGALAKQIHSRIKIPPGRQRMAEGDEIIVRARGSQAYEWCLKAIYKWFV